MAGGPGKLDDVERVGENYRAVPSALDFARSVLGNDRLHVQLAAVGEPDALYGQAELRHRDGAHRLARVVQLRQMGQNRVRVLLQKTTVAVVVVVVVVVVLIVVIVIVAIVVVVVAVAVVVDVVVVVVVAVEVVVVVVVVVVVAAAAVAVVVVAVVVVAVVVVV